MGYTRYNFLVNELYRHAKKILFSGIIGAILVSGFLFYRNQKGLTHFRYGYYGSYRLEVLQVPENQENVVEFHTELTKLLANSLRTSYFKMGMIQSLSEEAQKEIHFYEVANFLEIAISGNMFDIQVVTANEKISQEIRDYIRSYLKDTKKYFGVPVKIDEKVIYELNPVAGGRFYQNISEAKKGNSLRKTIRHSVIGFGMGSLLLAGIILLRARFNSRVKGPGDLKDHSDLHHVFRFIMDRDQATLKNWIHSSDLVFISAEKLSEKAKKFLQEGHLIEDIFQQSLEASFFEKTHFVLIVEEGKTSYAQLEKAADYSQQLGIDVHDAIILAEKEVKGLPC